MMNSKLNAEYTRLWVSVQSSVGAYVRSAIRDAQHADDILQEVAIAALRDYEDFDHSRPFLNWVLGIARYRILQYYRSSKGDRHVFSDAILESFEAAHEQIADTVSLRSQALAQCLDKLAGRARHVIDLRYGGGLPVKSIADHLHVTPNTVSRLLYRTRLALKACVEGRISGEGG